LRAPDATWHQRISTLWAAGRSAQAVRLALVVVGPLLIGVAAMVAAVLVGRAARRPGRRGPRLAAAAGLVAMVAVGGAVSYPWGAPARLRFYPVFDYYA